MALTAVGSFICVPETLDATGFNSIGPADASGEKLAIIFQAPKTGTIDRLCFRTATVTTGGDVDVRLETLDSTGFPSGTLKGTNTNATQTIDAANDDTWFETTLTSGASVTKGDYLAIVIVAGSPGNLSIARISPGDAQVKQISGTATYLGGAWSMGASNVPIGAVRYDDATYPHVPGMMPYSSVASTAHSSSTTPDEYANKFVAPIDCTVTGLWATIGSYVSGDNFDLVLYDSASTSLASVSMPAPFASNTAHFFNYLSTTVDLAAGSTYRMSVKPTTTNAINCPLWTPNASAFGARSGAAWSMVSSSRVDAGSWTDSTTAYHHCGIIISHLDDGAGGAAASRGFASVG